MKIKRNWLLASLVAAAGSVMAVSSAGAAVVTAPGASDLYIAFRASSGTGSTLTYIVDIGAASSFVSPSSTSFTVASGTGAALAATYGSDWATRSDLSWSVFGYNVSSSTTYASKERTDTLTQSTPWNVLAEGSRSTTIGEVSSVITNTTNGYRYQEASIYNSKGVFQLNNDAVGYAYQVTRSGFDFGSLSQWSSIEGNFGDGASGTILDLYRQNTSSGVDTTKYLGNFSIDSTGVITFSAVPEPSVALLGAAGTLLLLGGRRRRA